MNRLLFPLLLFFIFLVYAALPTRTYYWDGVLFSINIEKVYGGAAPLAALFHPNHLLYTVFGYEIYSLAQGAGLKLRALNVLQLSNAVLSTAACAAFFALARRTLSTDRLALIASLLFAFGALWWRFSTDGDSYVITVLFLLLASLALTARPIRLYPACLAHIAAMLFHELAIFFFIPALLMIWLDAQRRRTDARKLCAIYTALALGITGTIYYGCYASLRQRDSPVLLLRWISSYAEDSRFARSPLELVGPNLSTYTKLFFGGKLSFLRQYFSLPVGLAIAILLAALAGAILFRRVRQSYMPRRAPTGHALLLWGWLGGMGLFLAFFEPASPIHKVLVWAPLVLLLFRWLDRNPRWGERTATLACLCLAVAAWNFAAFAFPHSHDSADPVLVFAKRLDKELPAGAPVYYRYFSPDDWTLAYFTPGHAWLPLPLQPSAGSPACFETTSLAALSPHPLLDPAHDWKLMDSRHHVRVACAGDKDSTRP